MANVFNLGESFQRGYATGSQVVARREANKLAQQQAMIPPGGWIDASGLPTAIPPGAYTGDANALAQVAAHDPGKAYKLKTQYEKDQREGTQDDLAIEKTRLEIAEIKRESEQAAAEAAAKLSDAEKAAEERRIGGLVAGAREAYLDGPEAWEMFKQAYAGQIEASGMNPDALTYEMAPAAMAVAVGNLEGIKRAREFSSHFDPAEPEIKVIDGQIVQIGPDGASVMPVEGMQAPEPEPLSAAGKFFRDQSEGFIPPEQEYKPGGGVSVTVDNSPGLGKLSSDYGYVTGEDGKPVVDPETNLPKAAIVPGSKADNERKSANKKLELAQSDYQRKYDIVDTSIDKALSTLEKDGSWVAGWGSLLAGMPESGARDFQATIDTVKANLGFEELQTMRDLSPTGGALGQVTERELAFLQAVQANLDTAQSPEQLATVLREVKQRRAEFAAERARIIQQEQAAPAGGDLGAISPELEGVPKMYYDGLGDLDPRAIKSAWDMLTDQERALFE